MTQSDLPAIARAPGGRSAGRTPGWTTAVASVLLAALAGICAPAAAAEVNLDRVDQFILQGAFPGNDYLVMEYPEPRTDGAPDCRDRRHFSVFKRLPEEQRSGKTTHGHVFDLTVALCHDGMLGVEHYKAVLDASNQMVDQMLRQQKPGDGLGAEQLLRGIPVQIGARSGRAVPIFVMGHGVTVTPIAIIASRDAAVNLVIVMDDPHLDQPGHPETMQEALTALAAMLQRADQATAVAP